MWTTKGSHTLVRVAGTEHSTHLLSSATNAYMAGALGRMGVLGACFVPFASLSKNTTEGVTV